MVSSATPLSPLLGERMGQLVPGHVETMEELLALEHEKALETRRWAFSARRKKEIVGVSFLVALHHKMFDGIWKWAGQLRRTDHAEGARWPTIAIELNDLLGEVRFWRERKLYAADDMALRFHHRLFRIRAWEGGNGSHARLATDALAVAMDRPPFLWGQSSSHPSTTVRERYLVALREADSGLFHPLRDFARMT